MGDFLAGAGLFAAVLAVSAALLAEPSPRRSAAMILALALIPVLILGDQWKSTEVVDLRDHVARFVSLGVVAVVIGGALALLFRRRPMLLPLAIVAAVPFRVPLHAGGQEANLLFPLYLVIAGGVLASVWAWWESSGATSSTGGAAGKAPLRTDSGAWSGGLSAVTGPVGERMIPLALSAVLILYAIQSVYSEDFSRALQNVAFFYVPFALAFVLLGDCRWDRRLLIGAFAVVAAEALVFALFGFWEYGARHLIWNSEVIQSNDFHTYFRVNSLFWDPNVYGRFLALTIVASVAVLLWARSPRLLAWLGALIAILWLGLITTFSQSSFVALLVGLAALAALRWSLRWTITASLGAVLAAAVFVIAAGGSLKINLSTEQTLNKDTAGRANLVSEGAKLFGDRPLWGYGSGSFSVAYREHRSGGNRQLTVSHTEPVTVAAEQGLPGLIVYLAVLAAAFTTLLSGIRRVMPGLGDSSAGGGEAVARATILACFTALMAHTLAYAGFLEDPLTWVLLAVGTSLAAASRLEQERADARSGRQTAQQPATATA
jgi:putative inorganic carbon (hco3(-)) transporter